MSSSHTGDQPDHNSSSHTKVQQGQDGRSQVQYAEFDPSTAPQVCFGSAPEAFRPPIEPDIAHQRPGDAASQAATGEKTEGPKELWARLGKRKGLWLIGLAVVICIILAVGISVPLVGDKISRSSKGGSEASTSAPPSPTSNITSPTVSAHCPRRANSLTVRPPRTAISRVAGGRNTPLTSTGSASATGRTGTSSSRPSAARRSAAHTATRRPESATPGSIFSPRTPARTARSSSGTTAMTPTTSAPMAGRMSCST